MTIETYIQFILLYRLNELSDYENAVITALLRNYGGLFTDYGYIDESYLAVSARLDRNQVYQVLKVLGQKHIIDFIPRRNVPLIRYKKDRVDGAEIVITQEVYEKRREQFENRINAIISYADNGEICRSRQLLRYFGEKRSKDCKQCDVCLEHSNRDLSEGQLAPARQQIMDILADGKEHAITELRNIQLDSKLIDAALEYLLDEEIIIAKGSLLSKNS